MSVSHVSHDAKYHVSAQWDAYMASGQLMLLRRMAAVYSRSEHGPTGLVGTR